MNVLVVNCGSSSLKFQLINYDNRDVMAKGICERIGIDGRLVYEPKGGSDRGCYAGSHNRYPDGPGRSCE